MRHNVEMSACKTVTRWPDNYNHNPVNKSIICGCCCGDATAAAAEDSRIDILMKSSISCLMRYPVQHLCMIAGFDPVLQIQAGHDLFGVGRESIDLTFGGVTIVTAVVATLLGGWALDRVGSSIKNAMLLNGNCMSCS